jgi:signal transduction histidine kinase
MLWPLARRYAFDLLIVLGMIGAVVEFALPAADAEYEPTTSLWFLVPAVVVMIGALLFRRRLPFWAPVIALVTAGAASFVEENFAPGSFAIFLTVITSTVLLGMAPERQKALAGIPIYVAVVAIVTRNHPTDGLDDFFWITLVLSCAWVAGFALKAKLTAVETRRLRAEEEARNAVAKERARITRELHDVIAHSVSLMTVQASAARRLLRPDQDREREALRVVEETGRQTLAEMRRLLGIMREEGETADRAPQPGIETIRSLVQKVRDAGLPVELTVEGEPVYVSPGVDVSAYRIVQEALANALEHDGRAHAWVAVRYGDREVEVEVEDDGSPGVNGDGDGLLGMRERVALCGGELRAGPRDGGGFRISARLPATGQTV